MLANFSYLELLYKYFLVTINPYHHHAQHFIFVDYSQKLSIKMMTFLLVPRLTYSVCLLGFCAMFFVLQY